jgi:hypothetical protein
LHAWRELFIRIVEPIDELRREWFALVDAGVELVVELLVRGG